MVSVATSAKNGLIRWSKIRSEMHKGGSGRLAEAIGEALDKEDLTCDEHGNVDDPIVAMCEESRVLVWGCPYCAGCEVRALWEAQGND